VLRESLDDKHIKVRARRIRGSRRRSLFPCVAIVTVGKKSSNGGFMLTVQKGGRTELIMILEVKKKCKTTIAI